MQLIGRKKELELLYNLKTDPSPRFVAVYGRRRVGKTYLIRQAFDNQFAFYLTGMPNVSLQQQLANFHVAVDKYDTSPVKKDLASDWFIAFQQLADILEN